MKIKSFLAAEPEIGLSELEVYPPPAPEYRPSVFIRAAQHVFPGIFRHPDEMDRDIRQRIRDQIDLISGDPEIYGYTGGYGLTRKTYKLSKKLEDVEYAFKWEGPDKGKQLLAELEVEIAQTFEHADVILKKRAKKAEEDALEREAAQRKEEAKRKLEAEWTAYQKNLSGLKARAGKWPGFGIYNFPVVDGFPQDYQESGKVFSFDQDNFEVLPEETAPYWGFVTQWGSKTKVVLLLKVMEKPSHL